MAARDRRHPRDLFDVGDLLTNETIVTNTLEKHRRFLIAFEAGERAGLGRAWPHMLRRSAGPTSPATWPAPDADRNHSEATTLVRPMSRCE